MLTIRLARVGKRGHATFRVVATEHTRPPKSGALTQLGSYDPHANTLRVDAERLKKHLAHGAQLSPTVRNLLIEHRVIAGMKVRVWKPKRRAAGTGGSTAPSPETPAPAGEPPAGEPPVGEPPAGEPPPAEPPAA